MKYTLSLLLLASSTFIFSAAEEQRVDYYDTKTHTFKTFFTHIEDSQSLQSIANQAKKHPSDAEEMLLEKSNVFKKHPIKHAYLLSRIAEGYFNKDCNRYHQKVKELALEALLLFDGTPCRKHYACYISGIRF